MGFDIDRFEDPDSVDRELICSICGGVFENPVELESCEHVFCSACIERWLLESSKCPIDRKSVHSKSGNTPRAAPRIFRTLLQRMRIRCTFHEHGCGELLALDNVDRHQGTCVHNPEGLVICDKGCGANYKKSEKWEHNCVGILRAKLDEAFGLISHMGTEITDLKQKVKHLEEQNRGQRRAPPSLRPEVIADWAGQLTLAQVTYWGGLISTPDIFLQTQVKDALEQSCAATNCPLELIESLMSHSHERAWPPGLKTLEKRLFNRTIYEAYACRRVPGSQAVVILSQDNRHMSDDMILHPGLVVIFAHGVEDTDAAFSSGSP
ncbi:E3 ubiquitin-protein ligase NRDP1 [Hypsibius exemplaris]|uniref:E3 ubiquitin-protein ligase NRDP1 n=1 Tax=Hypsibius exemplaris TaxID=2072580 RepID=A0A1W0WKB5_HYPEX|nr:E3 ubiquitin-protein ligase NRDP1 [Hypsibius exemplaris]